MKVLNVFIGEEVYNIIGYGVVGFCVSLLSFVDDDFVGESGSDKGCLV